MCFKQNAVLKRDIHTHRFALCISGICYDSRGICKPHIHYLHPPSPLPPRQQGLISCFISHFTWHILHWAGPPTHQSSTPAAVMLCKCFLWSMKSGEEEKTYLCRTPIRCYSSFLLKGKLFFHETSLAKWMWIYLEKNTKRVKKGEVENKEVELHP